MFRESFLEKHNNGFVVNLQDNISFVAELFDVLPKGVSFLQDNDG
jgi:hypothetical protein